MFGYNSAYEYYKEANLVDKMDKIRIPVLCFNAADDPGQPLKCMYGVMQRIRYNVCNLW